MYGKLIITTDSSPPPPLPLSWVCTCDSYRSKSSATDWGLAMAHFVGMYGTCVVVLECL